MASAVREEIAMSDARTAILGRIDRALRTARIPSVAQYMDTGGARAFQASGSDVDTGGARAFQASGSDNLLQRFLTEARALGVDTFVEPSPEHVRERLAAVIVGVRVLSWNPDQLPYGAGAVVGAATLGSSPRADQAAAEVGVTGCHGAIAETGSIALLSGPGCSRAVSLLPPVHVALACPDDLFYGMGDFFAARAGRIDGAASCTFVTGPSRTADIELSLTIGVHGPGRVVIIVGP
jgi:L-lactate dehydrogenase complex protein LldG